MPIRESQKWIQIGVDGEEIRNPADARTLRASEPDALRSRGANGKGSYRRFTCGWVHSYWRNVRTIGSPMSSLRAASVSLLREISTSGGDYVGSMASEI